MAGEEVGERGGGGAEVPPSTQSLDMFRYGRVIEQCTEIWKIVNKAEGQPSRMHQTKCRHVKGVRIHESGEGKM